MEGRMQKLRIVCQAVDSTSLAMLTRRSDYCIQARGVLVHLFKTTRSNGDYRLLNCNCAALFPDISDRSHSPNRSGVDVSGVNQYLGRTSGVPATPQYMIPAVSMYQYASYPQVQTYAT